MSETSEKIRTILQFYFDKGSNASEAHQEICAVYGDNTLSKATAKRWFSHFRSGNFHVADAPRSGRPVTEKLQEIMAKVQQDRHVSSHTIAKELHLCHQTVLNHFKKAGYQKKLDVWVPHNLSTKNLLDRISICQSLLKRNEIDPFLKRLITGDEKWIRYESVARKRSWMKKDDARQTIPKPGLT